MIVFPPIGCSSVHTTFVVTNYCYENAIWPRPWLKPFTQQMIEARSGPNQVKASYMFAGLDFFAWVRIGPGDSQEKPVHSKV